MGNFQTKSDSIVSEIDDKRGKSFERFFSFWKTRKWRKSASTEKKTFSGAELKIFDDLKTGGVEKREGSFSNFWWINRGGGILIEKMEWWLKITKVDLNPNTLASFLNQHTWLGGGESWFSHLFVSLCSESLWSAKMCFFIHPRPPNLLWPLMNSRTRLSYLNPVPFTT